MSHACVQGTLLSYFVRMYLSVINTWQTQLQQIYNLYKCNQHI